jgi:hypothetical protein
MVKKCVNYLTHMLIHLVSFVINYLFFILLMLFAGENSVVGLQITNLISWIISMLFIFFVDKLFVPDLVNENNSKELYQFILIRLLSLIIEVMVIFIFISVIRIDYHKVKLVSLVLLFFFNI